MTFLQKNALEGEVDTHLKAKDVDAAFHAIDNAGIFASFFKTVPRHAFVNISWNEPKNQRTRKNG